MKNTFHKGKLARWNDDKGFGFISAGNEGRDIFIHISALKRMSRRPEVGDIIVYQTQTDQEGKIKAINAKIEGVAEITARSTSRNYKDKNKNNVFSKLIPVFLVVAIGFVAYDQFIMKGKFEQKIPFSLFSGTEEKNVYNYSCQGKVYCSEMTSCDEAKFYLRNCPNTQMDGDGDGIPCESQWCSW